ncbi:MAG TPA: UDP-N-acetylmuramoyl-L-alanyl-D-glutamate--2,6-diaminopimelate ligase [Anaerovoracaceae bacterium]|nr:UDP-N-acetylmuramoyl-L-alanyl-D-glutamate--2,6-diaminopimelate ligase [Anaerovoracaceae bacterium]
MKLKEILFDTGILCPDTLDELDITGVNYDSRKIEKGNMFVCLKGKNTDGHIYAGDAVFRGASAIVSEKEMNVPIAPIFIVDDSRKALSKISKNFYGNPAKEISLFGVTGTNGKTTVSYLIRSGLAASGNDCGLTGTISYKIGENEYAAERTTPESLDIQRLFSELKAQKIKCCVMEVSSHALQLGRVQDLKFDYSVFTNLSLDHMDFHKDEEEYYQTKKSLFKQTDKMGIINLDDNSGKRLAEELKSEGFPAVTFSMKEDSSADYTGSLIWMNEKGCRLSFCHKGSEVSQLESVLTGQFSTYNILAAASCLHSAGISGETINEGIRKVRLVPGRFEFIENDKDISVFVDFAHTPDALEKILKTANDLTKGRVICVFGCGGDRDRSKRPFMGKAAGRYADYCIVTSDNPRTENQQKIFADIEEGLYESGCFYEIIADRREAIEQAINIYKKGDIIVIAGKGHESYQIIGGAKNYFSDRDTVKELLNKGDKDSDGKN